MPDKPEDWSSVVGIPPEIHEDPDAFEILRVWAAGGKQVVSLRGLYFRDSQDWGIFVADLVRHIARSYELNYGGDFDVTIAKILASFDEEIVANVNDVDGRLADKDH